MKCSSCNDAPPVIRRSSSRLPYCRKCFITSFEEEVYRVIEKNQLIVDGDVVCIGVSGGKDSSVLAHVLATLKERYNRKWTLHLLAADEGIKGYRDDSLNVVLNMKNANYDGLQVLNFKERFGFTMDEVVSLIGKKNNCTVCGTFRRQILEIGARLLGANKLCTGHNIDDNAETVLLNICRNDLFKLANNLNESKGETEAAVPKGGNDTRKITQNHASIERGINAIRVNEGIDRDNQHSGHEEHVKASHDAATYENNSQLNEYYHEGIHSHHSNCEKGVTNDRNAVVENTHQSRHHLMERIVGTDKPLKRIKPMMYCYEKEIVLYARYQKLDYFSTECVYAPEAYRGYMRNFIKQLEAVDPKIIENIMSSSKHFYAYYPVGRKLNNCRKCGIEGINDLCKACITVEKLSSLKVGERTSAKQNKICY